MERTVAIKTLPRQLRQHLHREAKTIANLQHPAIVPVHDFGIAQDVGSVAEAATGFSAGTTAYTSPEQIRGDARIDARTDIYAMGATLFMLLTGKPPYVSDTPQGLAKLYLGVQRHE